MIPIFIISIILVLLRVQTTGNIRLLLTILLSLLPFYKGRYILMALFLLCNLAGNIMFHIGFKKEPYTDIGIYLYGVGHLLYSINNLMRPLQLINPYSFVTVSAMLTVWLFFIMGYIVPILMMRRDTSTAIFIIAYMLVLFLSGITTALTGHILHVRGVSLYIVSDMMVSYSLYVANLDKIIGLVCNLFYYSSLLLMSS